MRSSGGKDFCCHSAPNAVGAESTSTYTAWKPVQPTNWCGDGADATTHRPFGPQSTVHQLLSIGSGSVAIGAKTATVNDVNMVPGALIIISPTADPGSDIWISTKANGLFIVSVTQAVKGQAATFDYGIWV